MDKKNTILPKSYIYGLLLSIILILLDLVGFFSSIKSFRSYITYPILVLTSQTAEKITILSNGLFNSTNLRSENIELKQRILTLEESLDIYKDNLEDYSKYINTVRQITKTDYKEVTQARILSNHYNNSDGLILLDAGSNSGITVGSPVVYGKYYVCFIEEVYPQFSICKSMQIPGQEFVAYIPKRKVTGILNTTVKELFVGDLLATDPVTLGDEVKIKMENFNYYLTVGNIIEIPQKEGSAEKLAIITPSVNISDLTFVSVIIK